MTSNELEIFKQSILDDVRVMMQTTGQVTQYIGARYVPLFADPLDWSNTKEYEPLTIVLHEGNSFTSRQFVPKGIDISDESFWANTGNYNAQIEQYRQEVTILDGKLSKLNSTVESILDSELTELVVIGDSWCDKTSYGQTWVKNASNSLHLNLHNFAVGGSGFVATAPNGSNFANELEKAKSEMGAKAKNVKYVIVVGGSNDIKENVNITTLITNAKTLFTNAANYFPNAIIHFFGFNYRKTSGIKDKAKWNVALQTIKASNFISNIAYHTGISEWILGTNTYEADDTHPNLEGQRILSQMVVSCINGGDSTLNNRMTIAPSEHVTVPSGFIPVRDNILLPSNIKVEADFPLTTSNVLATFSSISFSYNVITPVVINIDKESVFKYGLITFSPFNNSIILAIDSETKTALTGKAFGINIPSIGVPVY